MDEINTQETTITSPFRAVLKRVFTHALTYLEQLEWTPVGATTSLADLRLRLGRRFPDTGVRAAQVIDELVADVAGGIVGSVGGVSLGGSLAVRFPPLLPPIGSPRHGIRMRPALLAAQP